MSRFENVSVESKANIYFDGKVMSHSIFFADGSKKTVGLIFPGTFHFNTDAPEKMEIIAGECRVKLDGQSEWIKYPATTEFHIPGHSSFDILVESGITEYICSFLS